LIDNAVKNQPLQIIIFGVTGDLARRKLLPALYHLIQSNDLPNNTRIIGITRHSTTEKDILEGMTRFIPEATDPRILRKLARMITIHRMDVTNAKDYKTLLSDLRESAESGSQRLYYLSIPAQAFSGIVSNLGLTGHNKKFRTESGLPKLLVEKPFGHDTESARTLINLTKEHFDEAQIFRIDHYIAKETAQNILTFRFENPLFESIWNARHVASIKLSAIETIGIEGRGAFYDQTGALRDIIQSHLLQVLALITMERPLNFGSTEIHRSKQRLLDSIMPIETDEVAPRVTRGQYEGYQAEANSIGSSTETFARLDVTINNEQWRKTPITIQAGKGLSDKYTEALVTFRPTEDAAGPNALIFRLQPNEGITIELQAKKPGTSNATETVTMDFDYNRSFSDRQAEAYERVIVDAIRGDQSLFASSREVMTSWKIIQTILDTWQLNSSDLRMYPLGTSPDNL
jgi:glucose-6-phosphate 1-dehydrogenase